MTVKKRASEVSGLERFNMYARPQDRPLTTAGKIRTFFWNPKTRQICGRTGASWSKIALFYFIFYSALAILVAICMWTFLKLLDARQPKWQLERSIIGTNPGLGFRPQPPAYAGSLIRYRGYQPTTYHYWVDQLNTFLKAYERNGKTAGAGQNIHNCDFKLPRPAGKVCNVDMNAWGPCVKANGFAYNRSTPCIFLKLNKIYGWQPQFYRSSDELPAAMPQDLKDHIKNITTYDKNYLKMVWVSCAGESPHDRENVGPIRYLPYRGVPGYYFPYTNQEGYLSPLVAVQLLRPKIGVLLNLECRAWAANIRYERADRIGAVHIELMVE